MGGHQRVPSSRSKRRCRMCASAVASASLMASDVRSRMRSSGAKPVVGDLVVGGVAAEVGERGGERLHVDLAGGRGRGAQAQRA